MRLKKGNIIQEARLARGLTQRELAELTGLSAPTVAKAEQGEKGVRLSTLRVICQYLKVDIKEVV